jgi:hypothetical protein
MAAVQPEPWPLALITNNQQHRIMNDRNSLDMTLLVANFIDVYCAEGCLLKTAQSVVNMHQVMTTNSEVINILILILV